MRGLGRTNFVAIMLLIVGTLDIVYGIAAISNSHFYENETHYVFATLHTWGWITVILGILAVFGGFSLFRGGAFGIVVGIVAASAAALGSLLSVSGAYPYWSLGVFALCVICLHGLVVYGEPKPQEVRKPGTSD